MSSRSSIQRQVLSAFIAAVLVVAALAGATWKMANEAAEATRWVAHTQEVLQGLNETKAHALTVEVSAQNHLLTGETARLAERDAAIAAREATMQRLRQLTRDNARQQERWARLREVADERVAIFLRMELLRRTQGAETARAYAASAPLPATRQRLQLIGRPQGDAELLRAAAGYEGRIGELLARRPPEPGD